LVGTGRNLDEVEPLQVLLGATVGTLVGYGVPLLHYHLLGGSERLRPQDTATSHVQLTLFPAPGGIGLMGVF